jgi:signal transduction histidine kinase
MCGNIICSRTDPALPFFTEGGSFWSNCTTELLASTTEEDRQARTRNRCNAEGYESVALIPLRSGDELIGLFQLNDRRRNQFTLQMIQFFEGLGASIGIALSRKQAEEEARKHSAELIEKNEELRAMAQQLWQAAKLATMGELSASIAHELNNPLATVSMRAESLLTKTQQDSPMWRELKIIEQEVERMATLIANLLQFSRRSQPQKSTVDICEEIEKALELIYYHLRKRNIVIWREFAKEAPCIHADRQQLRQLFLNLFTNASDAMPRGGTLTVRVTAPPESKQVIIEVADTGTGIPPEILPKVTDPFYTTKPEGEGTGLGLAICRRIVQEHNGTFDLTSEGIPGKGTTARISLPVTSGTNAAELK